MPPAKAQAGPPAEALRWWAQLEKDAWRQAVSVDPLLPDKLLPRGYPGRKTWRERIHVLAQASGLIH